MMDERFTDRARKVMQLANQEAQRFNHEYIGTEHILLGLVKRAGDCIRILDRWITIPPRRGATAKKPVSLRTSMDPSNFEARLLMLCPCRFVRALRLDQKKTGHSKCHL